MPDNRDAHKHHTFVTALAIAGAIAGGVQGYKSLTKNITKDVSSTTDKAITKAIDNSASKIESNVATDISDVHNKVVDNAANTNDNIISSNSDANNISSNVNSNTNNDFYNASDYLNNYQTTNGNSSTSFIDRNPNADNTMRAQEWLDNGINTGDEIQYTDDNGNITTGINLYSDSNGINILNFNNLTTQSFVFNGTNNDTLSNFFLNIQRTGKTYSQDDINTLK